MKRPILVAIAGIVVLIIVLWLFWPRAKPSTPTGAAYPSAPVPEAVAPAAPAPSAGMAPTPVTGLALKPDQEAKLTPILKKEDEQIEKILNDSKLSDQQKQSQIGKIRAANEGAVEKILSPEQYKRLIIAEYEHDGEALASQQ
jgi:hypothetical protein